MIKESLMTDEDDQCCNGNENNTNKEKISLFRTTAALVGDERHHVKKFEILEMKLFVFFS